MTLAFEDLTPGFTRDYGDYEMTRDEIIAFAREFDPQPFHLEDEAGRASMLGGLSASGWHTACAAMRLHVDHFLRDSTCLGAPGIEELRWLKPVRPGDRLRVHTQVLDGDVLHFRFAN